MQTKLPYSHDPLNDYRLIIDLPGAVRKKVAELKTTFDADYRGTVIAGGNPFIYLATFSQSESLEQQMSDAVERIALAFMPFKMHLRNFGALDQKEIFIAVEEKDVLQYLIKNLKSTTTHMKNARFNEIARVSLGQRLQPWQFEKSWKKYAHKTLSASFLADEMLLLKRMEGFRSWQVLRHMPFQNMVLEPTLQPA
ncbi:hypothetical protein GCM10027051_01110 [Niabella terrae]